MCYADCQRALAIKPYWQKKHTVAKICKIVATYKPM